VTITRPKALRRELHGRTIRPMTQLPVDDVDEDEDFVPQSLEASAEQIAHEFHRMANSLSTIAAIIVISFVLSVAAGVLTAIDYYLH
jgi:hypothetical protein